MLNQIFSFMVSDYAQYALAHMASFANSPAQEALLIKMLKKPALDLAQRDRVWEEQVFSLRGQYKMNE